MPSMRLEKLMAPAVAIMVLERDAVPQVGGAPQDVALDEGDLRPEPGGVGGGGVCRRVLLR